MKIIKNALIALAIGSMMTSCVEETVWVTDSTSTRSYDFNNITALQVATDFNAYVTFSEDEERVAIEANDNLFDKLDVFMDGNKLVVKLENNINVKGRETLNLFITTKNISWFKASSDAAIFLESPLTANKVNVDLSSDGHFEGDIVAEEFELRARADSDIHLFLETNKAYFNLSSNAHLDGELTAANAIVRLDSDAVLDILGTVGHIDAELSTDAELKGFDLEVQDLKVDLSTGAEAYVTVSETIDVTASTDGRLYYKGNADVVRELLSSGGRVIKK